MPHNNRQSGNENGVALVATLIFMAALGVLSTALVFTMQNEIKSSAAYKYHQQALYISNAGVQRAVSWFNSPAEYHPNVANPDASVNDDSAYSGYDLSSADSPWPQFSGEDVVLADSENSIYPDSDRIDSFKDTLHAKSLEANNSSNSGAYTVEASLLKYRRATFINPVDFTEDPSAIERWRLNVTGHWGTSAKPMGRSQITAVIENSGNPLFSYAIYGIDEVDLGGTTRVDSYDPTKGPWNESTNSGFLGSVGSNGSVYAQGTATLHGDLSYGPDVTDEYEIANNVDFNENINQITKLPEDRFFPEIPDFTVGTVDKSIGPHDAETISPGEYKDIDVKGELTLSPGVYYVNSLKVTSGGKIKISDSTMIFVKSGFDMSAQGLVNTSLDPTKLTVWYSGTDKATINGGTEAYLEFYGPNAPVELAGDSDLNGSFIGKTVKATGSSQIHFSEGCLDNHLLQRPFRVITWSQDINQ